MSILSVECIGCIGRSWEGMKYCEQEVSLGIGLGIFFLSLFLFLARLMIIDLEIGSVGYRTLPFCNFVYEVNSLRLFRISR